PGCAISAGGQDAAFIPAPYRLLNPISVTREGEEFIPAFSIPDPGSTVVAGSQDAAPGGVPDRRIDPVPMTCQDYQLGSGGRIPHPGSTVVAGGQDAAFISVPNRLVDLVFMPGEDSQSVARMGKGPAHGRKCLHSFGSVSSFDGQEPGKIVVEV